MADIARSSGTQQSPEKQSLHVCNLTGVTMPAVKLKCWDTYSGRARQEMADDVTTERLIDIACQTPH